MKKFLNLLQPVEFDRSFEPLSTVLQQKYGFNWYQIRSESQKYRSKFIVYPFELERQDLIPFSDYVKQRSKIQPFIKSDEGTAFKTIGRSIVFAAADLTTIKTTSELTSFLNDCLNADSNDRLTDDSDNVKQFFRTIVQVAKQFVKDHPLSDNADQLPVAFDGFSDSTAYHFLPSKQPFCQKSVQNWQQYDFGPFVVTALKHNQTSNVKIQTIGLVYLHSCQIFLLNLDHLNGCLFGNDADPGTIGCRRTDLERINHCQYLFERCQINVWKTEQGQNLRFNVINQQFFGQIDGHFVNGPFNGPSFPNNNQTTTNDDSADDR